MIDNELKKRNFDPEFDREEWFYKDKKGNIFPYWKEDIRRYVDPHKPVTFISLLQELDIPFIEEQWIRLLERAYNHNNPSVQLQNIFGKYLSLMKLRGFRNYTFLDTSFFIGKDIDPLEYYTNIEYASTTTITIKVLNKEG